MLTKPRVQELINYQLLTSGHYRSIFMAEAESYRPALYDALTQDKPITFDRPLHMEFDLTPGPSDLDPLSKDMLSWSGSMDLGGWKPRGSYSVISEKMVELLGKLRVPKYNLIPVILRFGNETKQYYIFHMYEDRDEYIDFDNCIYYSFCKNYKTRETKILNRFRGGYNSTKAYTAACHEYEAKGKEFEFIGLHRKIIPLKEDFDVLWIFSNTLKLSNSGRDFFQDHIGSLSGVVIVKVVRPPSYMIPKSETNLLDKPLDELLDNLS